MITLAAEGGYQVFTLDSAAWFWLIFSAVTALIAIAVGFFLMRGVLAADQGTPKMIEIAGAIQEGAMAYLKRQFKTIAVILVPLAIVVFVTSTEVVKPEAITSGSPGLTLRAVRAVPHARVRRRLPHVGPHRLHRHEPRGARQRAHGRGGEVGIAARRAQGGVPHRWRRRHVHGRPRPPRRDLDHHDLPEHRVGDPHRLRVRWLAARAVPARRRRHLHQGGRRRRRPGGQGRSRHPRGRPAQPGHHRRQRRRQRG